MWPLPTTGRASHKVVTTKRGAFPTSDSVRKVLYLAILKGIDAMEVTDQGLAGRRRYGPLTVCSAYLYTYTSRARREQSAVPRRKGAAGVKFIVSDELEEYSRRGIAHYWWRKVPVSDGRLCSRHLP